MHEVAHLLAGALISQWHRCPSTAALLAILLAVVFDAEKFFSELQNEWMGSTCIHLADFVDSCLEDKATFTHTLIYLLLVFFITWVGLYLSKVITKCDNWFTQNPRRGCLVIGLSLLSHLVLDIFTVKGAAPHATLNRERKDAHRYLYPDQFNWYLNTIFPDGSGIVAARVVIEWGCVAL